MKISADSWFGHFNGMSKLTFKVQNSFFLKKKPRSRLLLLGIAPINTMSPHKRLILQILKMHQTPIPNNTEELHPLIQEMLDRGGNNLNNNDNIGVMATAPMIDDNNQPAPENLLSTEDSTGATDDIMGLWTHSGICEWKAAIQCNAKPELTFWMWLLSNLSNLNLFEGLFFSSFIKTTILPQTNQNLPHGEKPILYGEFLCWIGLWMLMGTIIGLQRQEFWATIPIDAFHGAPLHLGIWVTRTQLEAMLSALTFTDIASPTFVDKFWEVLQMVEAWGTNMKDNFIPGYMNCLDESMSVWTNKFTCPRAHVRPP